MSEVQREDLGSLGCFHSGEVVCELSRVLSTYYMGALCDCTSHIEGACPASVSTAILYSGCVCTQSIFFCATSTVMDGVSFL
jgi:hypothetical protein